ncbi:MAG: hypothetical protein AB1755_06570 [Candidatus Omnitrophota bacterium]
MKKKILIFLVIFLLALTSISFAEGSGLQEEIDYSYGRIVSISDSKLELSEYDYDKNIEITNVYLLDPAVEIRNTKALNELSAGDNIEIDFIIKNNEKIIKVITLEQNDDDELDNL